MADPAKILARRSALAALRQPHEQVFVDCYDVTFPMRAHGFQDQTFDASGAQVKQARIYDSTAPDAVVTLASTLVGDITPANTVWFGLDSGGEQTDEESRWFEACARIEWQNIHAGNFDSAAFESAIDAVAGGWFVMYIDEADEGGYQFEQWPLAQCLIAASLAGGRVDTVYRTYHLTADQAIAQFGASNVHESVRKSAETGKTEQFEFVHVIEPRAAYVINAKLARNMRYASVHMDVKNKHICREGGYHEFPCAVPRMHKIPGSEYAVGQVYNALPDIRTVNEIKRQELMAGDIAIAPPLMVEDDGVINPRSIKLGPRKVIVVNDTEKSIKPLSSGANFEYAFTKAEMLQASIRRALIADQLPAADGPAKTAYEYAVRVNLIRKLLGPMFSRFQSEYLQTVVERCFGIAYRAGVFPPAPASLAGRNFNVRYLSPLARAQRLEEVMAIGQYVQETVALAQVAPDIMDTVDLDAAQRHKSKALGIPADIVPDKRAVAAKRKQRAEERNAQLGKAQAMQMQVQATDAALKQGAA